MRTSFQLIDEKEEDVEAIVWTIYKSSIWRWRDCAFCCVVIGCMDSFVKGQIFSDGNGIIQGIVSTDRVNNGCKKTLNGDDCIFLPCRLLKAKVHLSERGRYRLSNIDC